MSAATDRARASDGAVVRVLTKADAIAQARDLGALVLEGRARVQKYRTGESEPYETIESEPNLFLTAGVTNLWELAVGQGAPTAWNQANARLSVGSDTTAATAADAGVLTELASGRKAVDATGGIVVAGNAVTFTATYGTGDANGSWEEVGVTTAATGGIFLNRLVQAFGVKTSSAQWILQLTLSIS